MQSNSALMPVVSAASLMDGQQPLRSADDVLAAIEGRIIQGLLGPGQRLPPVRVAAQQFGLAPNTVAAAYRKLTERGLAHGEGRRGTFVTDRGSSEQFPMRVTGADMTDLSSGNPDPRLLPDLHGAIRRIPTARVEYGTDPIDPQLAATLGAELSRDLQTSSPFVAGEDLAIVSGALDGIERVMTAHLRPGDRVAVEDPGYPSILNLMKAMSLRPVPMAIDPSGPTPGGLATALEAGARAVVLTPRAQNPTGAAVTAARAAELNAIVAGRPEVLLIEDDHAGPIAGAAHRTIIGPETRHWAVIRSVAKSLGPDLRVAGLVGDHTTVGRVINRQLLGTGWVSHLLQRTTATLLADPDRRSNFDQVAAEYEDRRRLVIDILAGHGVSAWGATGLNVWVPVADEADAVAAMQRRGYAVLAGTRFRQDSGPAIRLSIGVSDAETLADAATTLAGVLASGPRHRSA
ncbi:MAG: aminotransferase class I/II-fold pyridoxal phosphate-dependent enzyme [Actinomycetota bacterium]